MKWSVFNVLASHFRSAGVASLDMVWNLERDFVRHRLLAGALLCACINWSHSSAASDFTADYWPANDVHDVCPTSFTALAAPRFEPKSEQKEKPVVRSDEFREQDSGSRRFTGNVKVQTPDLLLTSQELEWLNEGPLEFEHGLSLYHQLGAMAIDEAVLDLEAKNQKGRLGDLSFVMFDFPLQGSLKSLVADKTRVEVTDLSISGCDPRAERWGFRIKRIGINRETTRVTLRGVGLYIGKLPVFYLPFFTFRPPSEQNGFATTHFRYRSDNGVIVEQPIRYFGKFGEIELEPRYLVKNGLQLGAKVAAFGISSALDWVPNDKKLDDVEDAFIDPSRWRIKVNYSNAWRGVEALIDFTQPSDFAYQHDFEFDSLTQPVFSTDNTAALRYASRDFDVGLVTQRLNSTSEERLLGERYPEFDLNWQPRWGSISAISRFNGASYRDYQLRSHRGHLEQALHADFQRSWGELSLGATKSVTRFSIDAPESSNQHTRYSDSVRIRAGLNFDRYLVDKLYTIEPRLLYVDRAFTQSPLQTPFDQPRWTYHTAQLFDDNRTSGLDHIPGEHRISAGFRFHAQPLTHAQNVFKAEIAHVTHLHGFDGQSARLRGWGASLRIQNSNGFALEHRQYQNRHDKDANEFTTLLVYEPSLTKSLYTSIGRRPRDAIHQFEIGFRWPIAPRWEAIGAYGFDIENERVTDTHLGVAFTGCCYRTLLFVQRATDWDFDHGRYRVELDNRVMLRFDLIGLGKIGRNRIESLIDRKRFGFR